MSFKTFANQVILDAFLLSADFFKINFFEKLFQEYVQSVNLNSLDSDRHNILSKLFAKVISNRVNVFK